MLMPTAAARPLRMSVMPSTPFFSPGIDGTKPLSSAPTSRPETRAVCTTTQANAITIAQTISFSRFS